MTDNNLWPLPLTRDELEGPLKDDEFLADLLDGRVHDHDPAELHAMKRVIAELVRGASRRTRRQILTILDEMEVQP